MDKKSIIDAYCRIREIDNTIPDDVLNFMKEAALEKIQNIKPSINVGSRVCSIHDSKKIGTVRSKADFGFNNWFVIWDDEQKKYEYAKVHGSDLVVIE